jgi:ABC-type Fe3+-hydroxamate transport system substrate-binding protein
MARCGVVTTTYHPSPARTPSFMQQRHDDDKPASYFLENPLAASLKAAQKQRLYVVEGRVWRAYGPFLVNKIVDDLSKHLLDAAGSREEKQRIGGKTLG